MKLNRSLAVLVVPMLLPMTAHAHKAWLLPSETVLATSAWVTVDAAVSNDLFYFNHNPLRLENLTVTAPDGSRLEPQNVGKGKYRSTFDLDLQKPGTYRIATASNSLNATYEVDGAQKRYRGSAEDFSKQVPANAAKLVVQQNQQRVETFVTVGKPSDSAMKLSGVGLELLPVTHPNDLYAGEPAKFRFVLDGKPAQGVEIEIVPGGSRYRDHQRELKLTSDAAGEISITWPEAGMYWLEATLRDVKASVPQAGQRNATDIGTFEVLSH